MQDDVTIKCLGFYSQFCEVLYIFQDILIKYTHCGAMKILSLFVNYYTSAKVLFGHIFQHIKNNSLHVCHFTRKSFEKF